VLGNWPAKLCGFRESERAGVVAGDDDNDNDVAVAVADRVSSMGSALMATNDLPNADSVLDECAESVELLLLLQLLLLLLLGEP